ncbi:AfsR/SARP family transcriptional regulator [Nonomuraea salmonea]|uniref:AfsR/SARP family transcriptional regulator n=1 Tax=Nonomuraea salmonea TaxID=46181 RepID=UPI0031EE4BD2
MTAFRILGAVQALSADGPVHVPGKQRSMLGVLLLYPNTPVSLERLIDCLWEDPPASAVSNIHSYVTRLRRTVAPQPRHPGPPLSPRPRPRPARPVPLRGHAERGPPPRRGRRLGEGP